MEPVATTPELAPFVALAERLGRVTRIDGDDVTVTVVPAPDARTSYREAFDAPVSLVLSRLRVNETVDDVALRVECAGPVAGSVWFAPRTRLRSLGRALGLDATPRAGDADFDNAVVLRREGLDDAAVRATIADEAVRGALRRCIDAGLVVAIAPQGITLHDARYDGLWKRLQGCSNEVLRTLGADLALLGLAWRDVPWTAARDRWVGVVLVAAFALAMASVAMLIVGPSVVGSIEGSRASHAAVAIAVVWAVAGGVARRHAGDGLMWVLLALLFGGPVLMPLTMTGLAHANRYFDRAAPQRAVVDVQTDEASDDEGVRRVMLHFEVPPGVCGGGQRGVVEAREVSRMNPPALRLTLHRGAFGWCWMSRVEPVSPPTHDPATDGAACGR